MRVCDINNLYSPTGGGVRTYHERKIRYYRGRPDVPYALMVPSLAPSVSHDGSIARYDLPALALGSSGYGLTVSPSAVRNALSEFQPDVIEVGSAYVMPPLVHAALRSKALKHERRAVVGFIHANYPDTYAEPFGARLSPWFGRAARGVADQHLRATYASFDATFVASHHLVAKLQGLGVDHVYRAPLGVDADHFHAGRRSDAVRRQWGVGTNERLVVFIGRLALDKGIDVLLNAYPELRKLPNTRFVVVGHGSWEAEVQRVADTYGGMTLTGFMTNQNALADLYAAADVVLSLGQFETFSLATLEAQASGTPVVAPERGGAGELVAEAPAGATFEHGSVRSLVEACRQALATTPEDRRALAEWAGRTYAWSVCFDRLHGLYEQTLERVRGEAKRG